VALTELTSALEEDFFYRHGVQYSQDGTTPVFTTTDDAGEASAHGLTPGAEISITKSDGTASTPSNTTTIIGNGKFVILPNGGNTWEFGSGKTYVIETIPSDNTFTVVGEYDTSADTSQRIIEYHPIKLEDGIEEQIEIVEEAVSELEWRAQTLGQNKKIQEIAAAAEKASLLITANVEFAATAIKTAEIFLTGLLGPYIILLRVTADAIDNFVQDFRDIGFYVLEVTDTEGGYLIPKSADGNPILLLMSPIAVAAKMAAAVTANQGAQFAGWAKEFLGEGNILLTGPQKATYEVETGKKLPEDARDANAFDNKMSEFDPFLGMYKMTPSQVIATIVSAMDDKLDQRRPNFSKDAEAGAVVVLVGVADLTRNLANLKSVMDAFVLFFGGERITKKDAEGNVVNDEHGNPVVIAPGGIVPGGMAKLAELLQAVFLQVKNPDQNNVKIKVENVCIARGTEEDKIKLNSGGVGYIKEGKFEKNDFVVGPRVKFGYRCMGYVSGVEGNEPITTDGDSIDFGGTYKTQELTITGITNYDARAWRSLSGGAKIEKVAFKEKYKTHLDQNTGESVTEGPFNDFEYIANLSRFDSAPGQSTTSASTAKTKVIRNSGETLLTPLDIQPDVVEKHSLGAGPQNSESGGTLETNNVTIGDILTPIVADAPHPNFKAVKMDDLISDFKTFFSAIDTLTQAMRDMADGAEKGIKDFIKFLEDKLAELEEIAAALQKILALFTTGLGDSGVYVLSIPVGIGGNEYIKTSLQQATGRPPDTLDFTLGFMMMGGGVAGTEEGFKTLQKLLVP
jgi:hypothetical protein